MIDVVRHFSMCVRRTYVVLFLCVSFLYAGSVPLLTDEIAGPGLQSIDQVYREDFKGAAATARQIIRKYPDHPAGYFFLAAVLNAHMEYLQSEKFEEEFYRTCEDAVTRGEKLSQSTPNDVWVCFFTAGANGLMGTYESRYDKLLTAFKHGWAGVSELKDLYEKHPDLYDAQYGIASYDYWRSAMTKNLWFMPAVSDKRVSGIQRLYEALTKGVFVREATASALCDILYNEKRYEEVLTISAKMLVKYPNNLFFKWARAKSNLGLGQAAKAEADLRWIISKVESGGFESNYHLVMAHCFLQRALYAQQRYSDALKEYQDVKAKPLSAAGARRLSKILEISEELDKKARAGK